ncbi:hypothetical protein AA14362_1183 [Acetobacter cerevisiae DSM 14362]|nr:hypothetical protein AA14362_1183 [Acetobacter cerevisiae DSM 14362]
MSETAAPVSPAPAPQADAPAHAAQPAPQQPAGQEPAAKPEGKPAYLSPPPLPVLEGPHGIRFDFNLGARVHVPERKEGKWRVILRDLDTGNILFHHEAAGATISSSKRYYVRFGIEVTDIGADGVERPVFQHEYDARGQEVVIQLPVGTLGDTLAWFPYVSRFAEERGAKVTCLLSGLILPLLKEAYPNITLMTSEDAEKAGVPARAYAT